MTKTPARRPPLASLRCPALRRPRLAPPKGPLSGRSAHLAQPRGFPRIAPRLPHGRPGYPIEFGRRWSLGTDHALPTARPPRRRFGQVSPPPSGRFPRRRDGCCTALDPGPGRCREHSDRERAADGVFGRDRGNGGLCVPVTPRQTAVLRVVCQSAQTPCLVAPSIRIWTLRKSEVTMSELNGDKARFQRLRKAGLRRRQRARQAWATMQRGLIPMDPGSDSEQSGGAPGRVGTLYLATGGSVTE
jgi:hypothetical protein